MNDLHYSVFEGQSSLVTEFIEDVLVGVEKPLGRELFAMKQYGASFVVYGGGGADGVLSDVWEYRIGRSSCILSLLHTSQP